MDERESVDTATAVTMVGGDRIRRAVFVLGAIALLIGVIVALPHPTPTDLRLDNALQRWAADHHVGEPPHGFEHPEPVCTAGADLVAAEPCLARLDEPERPITIALRYDRSHPDADDHWITIQRDGSATWIERHVSAEPHPLETPDNPTSGYTEIVTAWSRQTCTSVARRPERGIPPLICEPEDGEPPAETASLSRPTTPAEHADLVRRLRCTAPAHFSGHC